MVNLYSHITNIRWQYDADPEDIRGCILLSIFFLIGVGPVAGN